MIHRCLDCRYTARGGEDAQTDEWRSTRKLTAARKEQSLIDAGICRHCFFAPSRRHLSIFLCLSLSLSRPSPHTSSMSRSTTEQHAACDLSISATDRRRVAAAIAAYSGGEEAQHALREMWNHTIDFLRLPEPAVDVSEGTLPCLLACLFRLDTCTLYVQWDLGF